METVVSDAIVQFQDKGTGTSSNVDVFDAAAGGLVSGGSSFSTYVESGLNITKSGGNWYLTAGVAYILDDSSSTSNERSGNGNPQTRPNDTSDYTVEIPDVIDPLAIVIVPVTTQINLDGSSKNDIYLKYDIDQNNTVTIVHGSSVSEPTMPSIHIAEVDTSTDSIIDGNQYADINANLNTVTQEISKIETITIPDGQTMIVDSGFTVNGTVNIEGSGKLKTL